RNVTGVQTCALPILSVTEEIHKRFIGLFIFALEITQRATSSPSRPASVATIISLTSFRLSWLLIVLNCFPVFFITVNFQHSGSMGKSSNFLVLYFTS